MDPQPVVLPATIERWRTTAKRYLKLARSDDVTRAANGRAFRSAYAGYVRRFTGSGAPFALIALDLDDFGRFNKRYGRATGDYALTRFVEATRSRLRPADMLFRLHGDEFIVLLTAGERKMVNSIAQRLERPIELRVGRRIERVSATAAGLVARLRDIDRLEQNVDRELRLAKRRRPGGTPVSPRA